MSKKELSPEQKLMKAIYGKPIEVLTAEEKRQMFEKFEKVRYPKTLKGE